jgi:hypothetical protein
MVLFAEKNIVTQVNTCPVMSTTEVSSDGHGHMPPTPQQQPPPPNPMPTLEEAVPDKKKKVGQGVAVKHTLCNVTSKPIIWLLKFEFFNSIIIFPYHLNFRSA